MSEMLPPGGTIGILGGGQLGRMLAVAASRLGLKVRIYADGPDSPAAQFAEEAMIGAYDDEAKIAEFGQGVDVVTCEFENVSAGALDAAAKGARVAPPARAFAITQDRLLEKQFVQELGISVAPFAQVDTAEDLRAALETLGTPALLKTRRFGYDGKGQVVVRKPGDAEAAMEEIGNQPAILEGFVKFDREVSVVVARALDGTLGFYDVAENHHQDGILSSSRVPASIDGDCTYNAREIAGKIATALEHVGVLCVEMFHCEGERNALVVNEIAPRVHNSGHWTIDGCQASQFENHIRAIAGWPLGPTGRHSNAVMINLIGHDVDRWAELAADERVALHLYGKADTRPGRKMGHYTKISPKSG
ncbi:N5-carboxyaminoimidazole ribonucleotide synthase [Methyloligella halotolerans]|uniref:N5-carboxyaminoimidazole ribonucleotide synthase n=1 Tax=Methyloligella halotolerans TaxID=1177755 RepID=A0A1E2RZD8_9HYPH|nr:5-(carboxyamino)imidazole ribonucleotide synthase [Methyloligella halotolerans]ODA67530.1 N5-carboxyaminoimidazole ribonucleotide synthase [Methyloligella halotolerans]